MIKFPPLVWVKQADSYRPGVSLWSADLADSYVVVQEVSIGEWGWQLCDLEGSVHDMCNDFKTPEEAKAAFEAHVEENGQ